MVWKITKSGHTGLHLSSYLSSTSTTFKRVRPEDSGDTVKVGLTELVLQVVISKYWTNFEATNEP